ncbi:MAG TPA: carboxypeptidase-like regulatory domain-containing protein, partial [Terriglobia bacterium]|nr:carboxypeptidase-like regulatory domain-containing protein [Terriglobia bacterium]
MRVLSVLLLMFAGQGTSVPIAPATVQGRVLDSTTGLPVSAATVELQGHSVPGGPSYFLSRDTVDDGTFNFPYVPPGDYAVEASGAGYVPATAQPQRLTLKPGQSLGGMQISLTPGAVIYGRAVDDRGDPVVGGIVQALRITYRAGRRDRIVDGSVMSNDLGEYRLFRLLPGEYQVSVIDLSRTERASVEWFYPGTVDPSEALVITLRAGEVVGGIGLPSVPTRGRRVSGSVQGAGGYGVSVILASRGTNLRMERTADPDTGGFVFNGVPPGAYTLAAHTTQLRANLPLEVRGADISNAR